MNVTEFSKELLRYGEIKADYQTGAEKGYAIRTGDYQRIRVIRFNNKVYVHYMVNGEVIEIKEV